MGNMDLYNKVKQVPEEAKKVIKGGRTNGFTDINPMWRIKVLTENFGMCGVGWYYDVEKEWAETVGDEICAFVNILLYVKNGDDWSKPIHGTGGSKLSTKERGGLYVSDECFKMATTDAISVACKQLGIGADVYWDKDKTKYTDNDREESGQKSGNGGTGTPQKNVGNTEKKEADKIQGQKITDVDISVLRKYMEANGLSEGKVLKKYRVNTIENLTFSQFTAIMDKQYLAYFKQECAA